MSIKATKTVELLDCVPPKAVDLTGSISGRLEVLGIHSRVRWSGGGQVFMWKARCECGNEPVVNGQHFLNGGIQSCGCLNKDRCAESKRKNKTKKPVAGVPIPPPRDVSVLCVMKKRHVDFRGKKVGLLTPLHPTRGVIYHVHNARNGNLTKKLVVHWLCQCDCGMMIERSSSYLSRGRIRHGCQRCCKMRVDLEGAT